MICIVGCSADMVWCDDAVQTDQGSNEKLSAGPCCVDESFRQPSFEAPGSGYMMYGSSQGKEKYKEVKLRDGRGQ